ncbi:unnamed protein product [Auanema sp. JU1783]|nr:unnamed protein product [Auanema sp. JU1783]
MMDNNGIPTEPGQTNRVPRLTRINMCPAKLAVRVSNVEEQKQRPDIEAILKSNIIAFTCTHWEGASPTISPFPRTGTIGEKYHRLSLSFDELLRDCLSLHIYKENIDEFPQHREIHIQVARTEDQKNYWSQQNRYQVLNARVVNPFIYYVETGDGKSWFCNDYSHPDPDLHYFVHLVFCKKSDNDIWCLQPRCGYWDTVKKTKEWTERGPDQRYVNDLNLEVFQYDEIDVAAPD